MNTWSILGMFFVSDTHTMPASEGNSFVSQSLDVILTQVWKMQHYHDINSSFNPSCSTRMFATQACLKEVEKS